MKKINQLLRQYEEIIRYLIIGGLTTVISLFTYCIISCTIFNPKVPFELQITNVITWVVAVVFAYYANRKYVFKQKKNNNKKETINFYLSRLSTLIVDMLLMYIFVSLLKFNDKIIKLLVQIIITILNYILSKFVVFKKE